MFPKSPAGVVSGGSVAGSCTWSAMTPGESTTGSCTGSAMTTGSSTGSAMTPGESTTGSSTGSTITGDGDGDGDATTGPGLLMTRGGWVVDCGLLLQAGEKFPGPHTYCAEAGGAAAR